MTTVLALDYGRRRIGVAVGDIQLKIAHPLFIIDSVKWIDREKNLKKLVEEWKPSRLVVGIPTKSDGSEHELAEEIRVFCKKIQELFQIPVILINEDYTSAESEMRLSAIGIKGIEQKKYVDSVAATTILEDFFKNYDC